jgi:hypothetical protein
MTDEQPIIIDAYCCSGGAGMGYHRAGFRVIGVDKVDRPRYPFEFIKSNALDILGELAANGAFTFKGELIRPAAGHGSPPCQKDNPLTKGTNGANGWGGQHQSLTAPTRELFVAWGGPFVLEQPVGSGEIRRDLMLCQGMFDIHTKKPPPWVQRHRDFEVHGFEVPQPQHPKHKGRIRGMRHGVTYSGPYVAAYGKGGGKATVPEMQHAMGIDWTDVHEELTEAIPPDYTEHIGKALLVALGR